jgi:aspartate/glutamate racemase
MWEQYSRIKPFGHQDRLLATIATILHNVYRGESEAVGIDAFLPIETTEDEQREAALEKALLKAMRNKDRK